MDMKRRLARGVAVLAIALAAGHLVQNMGRDRGQKPAAVASAEKKPAKVETVAAGPEVIKPATAGVTAAPAPELPKTPLVETAKPAPADTKTATETPAPAPAAQPVAETKAAEAPAAAPMPAPTPEPAPVKLAEPVAPAPAEPASPSAPAVAAAQPEAPASGNACDLSLELIEEPSAMIGITLLAPCHPNQRVVLRHGGLAVTGQTTATGALFTGLPAMETAATVEVFFADGARTKAEINMPELASLRRFGVQWQAEDAFQIHAFENGATYGDPGHVSASDPHTPVAGLPPKGGFLTLAGDATSVNPLLAEIYTYPADPTAKPEVIVEASVTDKTCGRELIGETLTTSGGSTFVTDLSLAMPECDAVGDYLVLKNLVLDTNMAAVN